MFVVEETKQTMAIKLWVSVEFSELAHAGGSLWGGSIPGWQWMCFPHLPPRAARQQLLAPFLPCLGNVSAQVWAGQECSVSPFPASLRANTTHCLGLLFPAHSLYPTPLCFLSFCHSQFSLLLPFPFFFPSVKIAPDCSVQLQEKSPNNLPAL